MTNVGYATLDVIPSLKGFRGKLERGTTPGLVSAGRSGGAKFGDAAGRSAGQRFSSVFRSAAKAGIVGTLAATAGAIKLGVDALGEARESQKVQRQTNAVIKSTGGAARVSSREVGKLAGRLSYMAGVDDELIQSGENVLLTFKDVRNEAGKGNRIFDKATKVALNMSTALGTDLKGANIQVGKALNDPIKGITALTRVGVTFTDQQKDQIKALVESGDKLAAQRLILKELGSEFGGSARSQASAADRLKVAFGNVEEKIGKGLLPVVQDLQRFILRKGIPVIDDFATWFRKDGADSIDTFINRAKPVVQKWLPRIADGFKTAGGYAKDAAGFAGDVVSAFDNMPDWVKKVLTVGAAGGLTAKKLGLTKALGSTGLFSKGGTPLNPLYVFTVNGGGGTDVKAPGSKVTPILKGAGTLLFGAAIAGAITDGVAKAIGPKTTRSLGSSGGGFGLGADSHFFDLDDEEIKRHNRQLSETKKRWIDARLASQDYAFQVHNGIPRSALTTVTNWPLENRKAREYYATLLAIRDLHMDTRLDRAGGSGPANSGFDPSNGTRPHGRPRSGTTVNIYGDVRPNDSKQFFGDLQRRAIGSFSTGGY